MNPILICTVVSFGDFQNISTLPLVASMIPRIAFIVVVFPAPFGPRKPNTSPEWRVREIFESISDFQMVFERFLREITVCIYQKNGRVYY
jgi:hypothetical protein